ncbi:transcriptional regulator [Helicobacter sp. 13S00401-1]|uniref:YebC/PmpR family DNA-binding transcriptional regulator n=1 Tax=Helicobacter sp. 13S00401-1 TaxID=1905758 RepID=UPI000BA62BE9|nr:YebC/PmpR family DNA-binding transcriptional regulator [Helicobacter sp. 13S00401-1]PAF50736.1 transcriptional regulator [Helicobacter sp. 13S00401-1]
MGRAFEYRRAAKEKRWDKMSKVFPKLAKAITVAAKAGGSDPLMNAKLRSAIATAKAQNMPKDNIEAAIKRASGKDGDFVELTYEGKAPGGVLIFVECTSDNPTRTVANLKSYFNKSKNASLLVNGSIDFMFERKAQFKFKTSDDLDSIELALIDFGLTEIEKAEDEENVFIAYANFEDFGHMQQGLEGFPNIEILSSKTVRVPTTPVEVSEENLEIVEKLLDKIEDDDDVLAVYTNIL